MSDYLNFIEGFLIRFNGPMRFRLVVQPMVAIFFAVRDGRKDAHENRAPYFWALFNDSTQWRVMLKSSWKSLWLIFIIAIFLDLLFQYLEFKNLDRWLGALVAGVVLAIIPYILFRGPVNRLTRYFERRQ